MMENQRSSPLSAGPSRRDFFTSTASGLGSVAEIIARLTDSSYAIHQAVGEGEDLRFDSTPGIAGGALFARGRVVHLCAFVSGEHQAVGDGSSYSASASQRRRYRNVA